MNTIVQFFRNLSPLILLITSIILGVLAKLIEKYSADSALGLQLLCFILFISAIYKFLNRKK